MRKISLNSVLCGRRLQGFGAPGYMATTVALQVGLCPTSNFSASQIRSHVSSGSKVPAVFPALKCKERAGLLRWKETRVSPVVVGAASPSFDAFESGPSTSEWEGEEFTAEMSPQSFEEQRGDPQAGGLVLSSSSTSLQTLSKDVALGIVLQAAGSSNGWTTGSGLEGPSYSMEMAGSEMPGPIFSKSPRRRMRVAFTCNVCGHRTTRAINPHAYTDGTVFVQCGGCDVFHKLVDNLKLFHELRGRIYRGYEFFEVGFDQPYDFLG